MISLAARSVGGARRRLRGSDMSVASFQWTTCRFGKRAGRLAIGLLAAIMLLAVISAPNQAFAHAALVTADPADGMVLGQSPTQFSLTFSEPVSPLVLTLVRPDGTPVPLTSFRLSDQTVEIDNPRALGPGTHVLSWRVISADGHPVGGSVMFSIGAPSAAPIVSEAVDWGLRSAIWTGKVLLYIGLFIGVGGAFAIAWLAKGGRSGQRFAIAAILCGLVAAPLSLGLQGLDALGAPLTHLAQPVVWQTGFGTSFGWTVLIALMALGLGLLSLVGPRADAGLFALAGLACVGAALAASGHASAAEPQWLTRPMVFLHGVGIAFWAGALAPLGLAVWRQPAEAGLFLRRFSQAILPVVAVLVATGIALAVIQVQAPAALLGTAYGRLLLVKLALLFFLFTLAATNRWKLTAPAEAGETEVQRQAGPLDRRRNADRAGDLRRCRRLALHAAAARAGDCRGTAGIDPYPHAESDGRPQHHARPCRAGYCLDRRHDRRFRPARRKGSDAGAVEARFRHRTDQAPGDQAWRRHMARR